MKTLQVLETAFKIHWIFFPLSLTLHNLEEVLWLPKWTEKNNLLKRSIDPREFIFAILIITIFAYLSTFFAKVFDVNWFWKHIFYGYIGAMIMNIIFYHLLSTIILREYLPGLLTGVLIVVPINSSIIYQTFRNNNLRWLEFILSSNVVSAVLVFFLPILYKIGRKINNEKEK